MYMDTKNNLQPSEGQMTQHKLPKSVYILISVLVVLVGIAFFLRLYNGGATVNVSQSPLVKEKTDKGKLYLIPDKANLKVGENLTVNIMLSAPGYSIDGSDVILKYDPNLVSIATANGKITAGILFPQYPKNRVDETAGKLYLTGLTLEPKPIPLAKDGLFGSFTIKGKAPGKEKVSFEFMPGSKRYTNIIQNGTSSNILGATVGGEYEINK